MTRGGPSMAAGARWGITVAIAVLLLAGCTTVEERSPVNTGSSVKKAAAPPLPPLRFTDQSAAISAVLKAQTIIEVEAAVSGSVSKPYGFVFRMPLTPTSDGPIRALPLTDEDLEEAQDVATTFLYALSKYRPSYFQRLRLREVVIAHSVTNFDKAVGGVHDSGVIYYAMDPGTLSEQTVHHEIAHSFHDTSEVPYDAFADLWEAQNPPGFVRTGEKQEMGAKPSGFASSYATKTRKEDFAELWGFVMAGNWHMETWTRIQQDARLRAKFDILIQLMALYDPQIGAGYLAAVNGYPNPGYKPTVRAVWDSRTGNTVP